MLLMQLKLNDLATATVDKQTIRTVFNDGETTIADFAGTGIFSILTTLNNEGVTGYTFDDTA